MRQRQSHQKRLPLMPEPPRYFHHCRWALQPNARKIARDGFARLTKKKKKMIGLFSLPVVMMTTTTQMTTKTATKVTTTTTLCSDDYWALNAHGTMRTPLAQRIAKCRQVKPVVDSILCAGNAVQQGALFRGVLDHPSAGMFQRRRRIRMGCENRITAFSAQWRLACL